MTDMLAGVVSRGTARAADLGRPTAGKTGTTSSSKDAWFIGFSSGITTGVWMGRDDNQAIRGLSGGQAPARTCHDFMIRAVARRPVEPFRTDAQAPDWPTGEAQNEFLELSQEGQQQEGEQFVDQDGQPIDRQAPPQDEDPYGPDSGRPEDDSGGYEDPYQ
jgi:penicillin-binding protein 1A